MEHETETPKLGDSDSTSLSSVQGMMSQLLTDLESLNLEMSNEAQEKALGIHVIATKICDQLDPADLKNLRGLNNKSWTLAATNSLISRSTLNLKFDDSKPDHEEKLKQLNSMLKERDKIFELCSKNQKNQIIIPFPFVAFEFRGNFSTDEQSTFFNLYGHKIRSLSLLTSYFKYGDENSKKDWENDVSKFLKKVPNLTTLRLSRCSFLVNDVSDENSKFDLENLTTFICDKTNPFLFLKPIESSLGFKILTSSPNLKCLKGFQIPRDYNLLRSAGKCGLVKNLKISNIDDLFSLIVMGEDPELKFESILIDVSPIEIEDDTQTVFPDKVKMATAFTKILEMSKDTLLQLSMRPLGYLDQIFDPNWVKWPRLSVLQNLHVISETVCCQYIDPPALVFIGNFLDFKIENSFPALQFVWLDTLKFDELDIYFPPEIYTISAFTSVQQLKMDVGHDYPASEDNFDKINRLFPNLKILQAGGKPPLDTLSHIFTVWGAKGSDSRLEILEFYTRFNHRYYDPVEFEYDSILTGISRENCKILRRHLRIKELLKGDFFESTSNDQGTGLNLDIEKMRCGPSILDLKGLKTFRLHLCTIWPNLMSDVTRIHAFDVVPGLTADVSHFSYI